MVEFIPSGTPGITGPSAIRSLKQPVIGIAASPTGHGYWLATADGGVFSFGDAAAHGSLLHQHLTVTAIAASPGPAQGYWLLAAGGSVHAFGAAKDLGSASTGAGVQASALAPTPNGAGYVVVTMGPSAPSRHLNFLGNFLVTCYDLSGLTKSGAMAGPQSVAVDPGVIPLGTQIYVRRRWSSDCGRHGRGDRRRPRGHMGTHFRAMCSVGRAATSCLQRYRVKPDGQVPPHGASTEQRRRWRQLRRRALGSAGVDGYQALLLVSFGGPERAEDVKPFLRRVTAGRDVPESRLDKVAEHYYAGRWGEPAPGRSAGPCSRRCGPNWPALRSRFTGGTVTGTPCWKTRSPRCAMTASSVPWHL